MTGFGFVLIFITTGVYANSGTAASDTDWIPKRTEIVGLRVSVTRVVTMHSWYLIVCQETAVVLYSRKRLELYSFGLQEHKCSDLIGLSHFGTPLIAAKSPLWSSKKNFWSKKTHFTFIHTIAIIKICVLCYPTKRQGLLRLPTSMQPLASIARQVCCPSNTELVV